MKPESLVIKRFRESMARREPDLLIEKTNNPYVGGILDLYFETHMFAGWVEVKYRPIKPAISSMYDTKTVVKMLSEQQVRRFRMHVRHKMPCALMAGFKGENSRNRSYVFIQPFTETTILGWPTATPVLTMEQLCDRVDDWMCKS